MSGKLKAMFLPPMTLPPHGAGAAESLPPERSELSRCTRTPPPKVQVWAALGMECLNKGDSVLKGAGMLCARACVGS
ncbi:PREDICTED: protein C10 [Acanthisitta chloris]|uniref:protein C10 n=1 Tax=Acanthisitta chloris TaxID=57068 RepID=UPI0004F0E1B3|nr:PREDICTED: protein C10 [Acanthisitta chloris]